jgi:hypothetical protein
MAHACRYDEKLLPLRAFYLFVAALESDMSLWITGKISAECVAQH